MLHPSCLLTPEWQIHLGGKSYFYIRFTCNGSTPTLGKEQVMVKYGPEELVSSDVCISSTTDPGLVGPFEKKSISGTNPEDVPEVYAYIYFQTEYQASPLRKVRTLFAFYQNVGINGGWENACMLQRTDGICDAGLPPEGFKYFNQIFTATKPAPEGCDLFVIQIKWKKCPLNLYELDSTIETINGQQCTVYTINFSGLYLIKSSFFYKSIIFSTCEFTESTAEINYVSSALLENLGNSDPECQYGYYWDCDWVDPCPGYFYCFDFFSYITAGNLSGSQFIILTNAFGANPVFPLLEASSDEWVEEGRCLLTDCDGEYISKIKDMDNTNIPDRYRFTFELALSPASLF